MNTLPVFKTVYTHTYAAYLSSILNIEYYFAVICEILYARINSSTLDIDNMFDSQTHCLIITYTQFKWNSYSPAHSYYSVIQSAHNLAAA